MGCSRFPEAKLADERQIAVVFLSRQGLGSGFERERVRLNIGVKVLHSEWCVVPVPSSWLRNG